jgi:pantetheine-phosphate adenylyltransferase
LPQTKPEEIRLLGFPLPQHQKGMVGIMKLNEIREIVDFMKENGVIYTIRGVRNTTDYEYENKMHEFNSKLYPEIVTLYIPCNQELKNVSSTAVKKDIESGVFSEETLSKEVIGVIKRLGN